jgi:hypothetical protein
MMLGSEEPVTLRRGLDMALVTGAALPAGRVLALWFVGLLGGLATLTVARSRRVGGGWPGGHGRGAGGRRRLPGGHRVLPGRVPLLSADPRAWDRAESPAGDGGGVGAGVGGRGVAGAAPVALAAPLLIAAWLAEALRWAQQGRGMLLDGDGALGVGVNLGDGSGGA